MSAEKRMWVWDFLLLRIPKCGREDDSGCVNALFCFSMSFTLCKTVICVGVSIYIWVIKNVNTAKGVSGTGKPELQ